MDDVKAASERLRERNMLYVLSFIAFCQFIEICLRLKRGGCMENGGAQDWREEGFPVRRWEFSLGMELFQGFCQCVEYSSYPRNYRSNHGINFRWLDKKAGKALPD